MASFENQSNDKELEHREGWGWVNEFCDGFRRILDQANWPPATRKVESCPEMSSPPMDAGKRVETNQTSSMATPKITPRKQLVETLYLLPVSPSISSSREVGVGGR